MNFNYVLEGSPIDFFQGSMTFGEVENNIRKLTICAPDQIDSEIMSIKVLEAQAIAIVKRLSSPGEEPHTVHFFAIPNFNYCSMEYCVIAKIKNNGTTYIFSNNRQFLEAVGGTNLNIKDITKM